MDETDVQLQLKKRARRRVVGAVVFFSVVALILPMIMDHEPRHVVHDVEIQIPGQDEKSFAPKFDSAPVQKQPVADAKKDESVQVKSEVATPTAKLVEVEKPEKSNDIGSSKSEKKPEDKPEKPPVKTEEKAEKQSDEAKRAAAILSGKSFDPKQAEKSGDYLILIGAFSNEANVKNLKIKLDELGIKSFTEPLNSPQGRKTRVRAGPFSSHDAAEKALAKMRRIGLSGVIATK